MEKTSLSQFSEELLRIMLTIHKGANRMRADFLTRGNITIPQYLVLDLLTSGGQAKMKKIAQGLGISLPAATGLIARLVSMSMVQRTHNVKDRRVIYITPTAKGKKTADEIKSKRRKTIEDIFGKLTEQERRTYLKILRKVEHILSPKEK